MKYSMVLTWSAEDGAYLVYLPEWEELAAQPVADGATYEEAARRGGEALDTLIEVAKERGQALPQPQIVANA
ncbi:MAG TPA: type II toxin-antitoxin system HicB family antitoxin [Ktedonobacterales bacterium]